MNEEHSQGMVTYRFDAGFELQIEQNPLADKFITAALFAPYILRIHVPGEETGLIVVGVVGITRIITRDEAKMLLSEWLMKSFAAPVVAKGVR